MSARLRDYFLGAGLGVTILLFLNIGLQMSLRKGREVDIKFPEEPQALESPGNGRIVIRPLLTDIPADSQIPQLELLGTTMGNSAAAFIYNPENQSSGLFKRDDKVAGFKISQILPGKVVLEKDGISQELLLTSRRIKKAEDKELFVAKDESGTMFINKFQLMAQMFKANEILSKIKIMPQAGVVPNKLKGFKIENVPSGSILEEAGIKNGDIIYSIQGQRLETMHDALAMFNRIQNQSRVEMVLLRNEVPVTLKYEIH